MKRKRRIKHIIQSQQFSRDFLESLFKEADKMRKIARRGRSNLLKNKVMATTFYEPSTRTRFSFESAMIKLGGHVITTENAREFSSVAKGETLNDTIKVMDKYADVIVLRHFQEGAASAAAAVSNVPIINAGDGPGHHPTQSLLDIYTIKRELGKIDRITIAMVGDLKHGRTVRSLAYLLTKFHNIRIYFVAPKVCKMKKDILDYLNKKGVHYEETEDLNKVLPLVDCVYMTRVQKERFKSKDDYNKAKGFYRLDKNNIGLLKSNSIIMHPLPRIDEISPDIDQDPRSAYFRQAENGLYIRMALLKKVLT